MQIISTCPLCRHGDSYSFPGYDYKPGREVFEYLGLPDRKSRWSICKNCGFVFQNPRPDPDLILGLYAEGIYRQGKQYSDWYFQTRYQRPLTHLAWAKKALTAEPVGPVLDIGAGFGGAVRAFMDSGYQAQGVEADAELCAHARKTFGIELIGADLRKCEFTRGSYGVIYSAHVHEHFDDFDTINQMLSSWLAPGGILLCVVPTFRFAARNGQGFINVFHDSMFTRTSLRNMFVKAGLEPVAFRYPLNHSQPEVWGIARKREEGDALGQSMTREYWRAIAWEIRNCPRIFESLYHLKAAAYPLARKVLGWNAPS